MRTREEAINAAVTWLTADISRENCLQGVGGLQDYREGVVKAAEEIIGAQVAPQQLPAASPDNAPDDEEEVATAPIIPEPKPQTMFEKRAQILIDLGIPTFPLPPKTKAAKLDNWQGLATTDLAKLTELHPDPDGNTAAVARAELDGFCFFEVDAPDFHKVVQEQTKQKFPETLVVSSSPGKGRGHFYFRHSAASIALALSLQKAFVSGKGENGKEAWSFRMHNAYVVGPNSVKDTGEVYTIHNPNTAIADIPDWLVQWIADYKDAVEVSKKTGDAELDDEAPIPEGRRNIELTSILGKARQLLRMNKKQLYVFGQSVNENRCRPPLPDSEVKTIAYSVGSYKIKLTGPETVIIDGIAGGKANQASRATVIDPPVEDEQVNPEELIMNVSDSLPSSVLASSRLGDIYLTTFAENDWPLVLALPALVTAASVIVPRMPRDGTLIVGEDPMTNLFTALIAPVNAGKSQIINWAASAVGIYEPPVGPFYFEGKFGSAEQMLKSLWRKQSKFPNKAALINPDEWSHLFAKAVIPDASFPSVMNSSFYRRHQVFTLSGPGGGKEYSLDLAMSFIGGIVEDEFDTVFGAGTLGGLYDRFLFGRAPDNFKWSYEPFPVEHIGQWSDWGATPVNLDGSVYEVMKSWARKNPGLGRIGELCLRVATVFASVDGRNKITGKDIEPLEPLAQYQIGLRQLFKPNPGLTSEAIFANKALAWLSKCGRQWVSISQLKHHLYRIEERLGPNVAERALTSLARGGRIDLWTGGPTAVMPTDYSGPRVRIGLVRMAR